MACPQGEPTNAQSEEGEGRRLGNGDQEAADLAARGGAAMNIPVSLAGRHGGRERSLRAGRGSPVVVDKGRIEAGGLGQVEHGGVG